MKICYHNHDEQGVPLREVIKAFSDQNEVDIDFECKFKSGYTHYIIHDPKIQKEVITDGKIWEITETCVLIFISSQGVELGNVLKRHTKSNIPYYIYGIARQLSPRKLITSEEWKDIILTRTAKYISNENANGK